MSLTKVTYSMIAGAPVSVLDFGAVGDGVANDTVAIQNAINSVTQGTVYFPPGVYLVSANISLKSNVNLQGENAKLTYTTSWASYGAFFNGSNVSNVEITGFIFDGKGIFSATPFPNPYGGGNSVGFTNNQTGIQISSSSSNVRIHNNTFTGLGRGILITYSSNCEITNNTMTNLGAAGVGTEGLTYSIINNNIIRGVLGNLTAAGDTSLANSQYADGVYTLESQQVIIDSNVIENIIRIGVVLEGNAPPVVLNTGVVISNNTIKNMNSCRGAQYNAAVWSEGGKTKDALIIGNSLINTGATAGTLSSIGVVANNCTVVNNYITGFNDAVQIYTSGEVSNNQIISNGGGINPTYLPAGSTVKILGNTIKNQNFQGIEIYHSHGTFIIQGNVIENNGLAGTVDRVSGIMVNRYYNDQKVVINGNTFVSSANQGDTTGQLYSIIGIAGGDFSRTTNWITNNQFIFTGTFSSSYPLNLHAAPCSFAYDNTSPGGIYAYEIMPVNGNLNSKMTQPGADGWSDGYPYMVGFASAIPVSGTYRQGDYLLNSAQTSGQPFGWVCTTGGTPGTWKIISTVS